MAEKRSYNRVRVNMRVGYRDENHADKIGRVMDISKGGMYVQTGYYPEVKGRLIASLDAEDFGKIIWVEGHVVWRTRTGIAVMFTNTDEKGLRNLLASMLD